MKARGYLRTDTNNTQKFDTSLKHSTVESFVNGSSKLKIYLGALKGNVDDKAVIDTITVILGAHKSNPKLFIDSKNEHDYAEIYKGEGIKINTRAYKFVEDLNKSLAEFNDDPTFNVVIYNQDKFNEFRANQKERTVRENSMSKFLSSEFGKNIRPAFASEMNAGVLQDSPMTYSEPSSASDNSKVNNDGQNSLVLINDFNRDLTIEGYSTHAPGAERLIEEKGITDSMLRSSTAQHEYFHALDNTNYDEKNGSSFLGQMYTRYRMEIKADLGALIHSYKINGDFRASEHDQYIRANNTFDDVKAQAMKNAFDDGLLDNALDLKARRILTAEASVNHSDPQKKRRTSSVEKEFSEVAQTSEIYQVLQDVGMTASYNTAPILRQAHRFFKRNPDVLEAVSNMKMKELNAFIDDFVDKRGLKKKRFGELIFDMASVSLDENGRLAVPPNKDLLGIINVRNSEIKKAKVTEDEMYLHNQSVDNSVIGAINSQVHSMANSYMFTEAKVDNPNIANVPDDHYKNVSLWADGLSRHIEREAIKPGVSEKEAFSKVISFEIDRIRASDDPYAESKLKVIGEFFIGDKDTAFKRMMADKEVRDAISKAEVDEITESGKDLVALHITNQFEKLDKAETMLKTLSSAQKKAVSFASQRKIMEEASYTYDDIILHEKKAHKLAGKILRDDEALALLGKSEIIHSKITTKSGGRFPTWIRDFLLNSGPETSEDTTQNLLSRVSEKKKMLANEVSKNDALIDIVGEYNRSLAIRIKVINDYNKHPSGPHKRYRFKGKNITQVVGIHVNRMQTREKLTHLLRERYNNR